MEEKKTVYSTELSSYISSLREEMQKKGYSPKSIASLEMVWNKLEQYSSSVPSTPFDENFRSQFLKVTYGFQMDLEYTMYRASRALELLKNYIDFGVVTGKPKTDPCEFDEAYQKLLIDFADSEARRGLSEGTMKSIYSRLYTIQCFMIEKGAKTVELINTEMINDYIKSLAPYSTTYVSECLRLIRKLLAYSFEKGYHPEDLSGTVPFVKNVRQQKIPATFTEPEITAILDSFNREDPMGKRNYAIFLVAARLGLRSCDIRGLKFSNINWNEKTISITQQKTRRFLTLPFQDDVGWAIIDYLQHGRPASESEYVFIQHVPPYNQYGNLREVLIKQMRKAGVATPPNKKIGLHCFRHSLATEMLEKGVSLPVISQTLGHADISSTEVYLRINMGQLRQCPLEVNL